MTLKNGFRNSVCYLFHQPMDEKNKTWTPRFPAKENPNMENALFDWPIVLQCDVKAISRKFFGHEVFSAARSLNQPKARCVCIHLIHQSNRFISVRLLFLFHSRIFISRSHENRSICFTGQKLTLNSLNLKHSCCLFKEKTENIFLFIVSFLCMISLSCWFQRDIGETQFLWWTLLPST